MEEMDKLQLRVSIGIRPNEVIDPVPFDQDETHRTYEPEYTTGVMPPALADALPG